jgi:hypothetical protein
MTWIIRKWTPPVRDAENRIVKAGFWVRQPSVQTAEEAEALLRALGAKGLCSRADLADSTVGEWSEMGADSHSFWKVRKL